MTNATELTGLLVHDNVNNNNPPNNETTTALEDASVAASCNGSISRSSSTTTTTTTTRQHKSLFCHHKGAIVVFFLLLTAIMMFVSLLWSHIFFVSPKNNYNNNKHKHKTSNPNVDTTTTTTTTSPSSSSSSSFSTQSKYKKVQGIGFQIYTGGAPAFLEHNTNDDNDTDHHHRQQQQQQQQQHEVLNPECMGLASYGQVVGEEAPMLQCYIGMQDAAQDVQERLQIMRDAVERAYQTVTNADDDDDDDDDDSSSETLKIFLAPEFYWRGIDGAYVFQEEAPDDPNICGPVCQLLQGLEGLVADARFQDWLFVFGTVIASEQISQDNDDYDYLFYNFAPMYKGYDPAKQSHTGKRFIVPKRYVSSSDFLTPQRHLNASTYKELLGQELPEHDTTVRNPHDFNQKRYDNAMWLQYKDELNVLGYTMIEYDWFVMDGLSMTLEICFDHQMRTALNSWMGDAVTGRHTLIPSSSSDFTNGLTHVPMPSYQAQISLVSSAGMTATPESMALTNGGIIFVQDGLTNETNHMYWGMEGCELGLQFAGGTEAVQRRAFLSSTDVVFEHTAIGNLKRHDLYPKHEWEEKLKGLFSAKVYPPQMIVFDPVDIAQVAP